MSDKPKITGHRVLIDAELAAINQIKAKAQEVGELVEQLQMTRGLDQRAINIGKTELQTGFMWLTRGIAQPNSF